MNLEEIFKSIASKYGNEIGCYIEEEINNKLKKIYIPEYILIDKNKLDEKTLNKIIELGAYNGD